MIEQLDPLNLDPAVELKQGEHDAPWTGAPVMAKPRAALGLTVPTLTVLPPLLSPGLWLWVWNKGNPWSQVNVTKLISDCARWGIRGILPHSGTGGLDWLASGPLERFRAAGLGVVGSLGIISTQRIVDVLHAPLDGCCLDWETYWDGKQALAQSIVDAVLTAVPAARGRVIDCPWWAPLFTPNGHPTHPRAPTLQFGELCVDRYTQDYGAPVDGRTASMLAWSRNATQYASFHQPWLMRSAAQGYHRSVSDVVTWSMAESTNGATAIVWDYLELDASTTCALDCRIALLSKGFAGALAVQHFQQAHPPLVVDGIVGPKTCAALGVTAPAGVVWTHPGSTWP